MSEENHKQLGDKFEQLSSDLREFHAGVDARFEKVDKRFELLEEKRASKGL